MNIVADADLFRVEENFGHLGKLYLVPGREIKSTHLKTADALIVRSITAVTPELLRNTPVRFVGTATSGIDHIDANVWNNPEVCCAHAKGSNANAVVDYVFAVLAELDYVEQELFESKSFGIVGCGAIGGRLAKILIALGAKVKINDPPLQLTQEFPFQEGELKFESLEETLRSDVISIHTPLTHEGHAKTANLISKAEFELMPEDGLLIHSCRGGVVDELAAIEKKSRHSGFRFAVDVWSGEPHVSSDFAELVDIGTPHIAGYSFEAKQSAVSMIRTQLLDFFEISRSEAEVKAEAEQSTNTNTESTQADAANLKEFFLKNFPVNSLSDEFKLTLTQNRIESHFDSARKALVSRREFKSSLISYSAADEFEKKLLKLLGVK